MNGTTQNIVSNIQYRGDNQMTSSTFGNGLIDERSYDLQGRLTNQLLKDALNNLIDDRSYSHDKNSNVININTNYENNAYLYDKLDRITSDTSLNNPNVAEQPIEFTYDLNDNRTNRHTGPDPVSSDETNELVEYLDNTNRISVIDTLQIGTTPLTPVPSRDLIYNDVGRLYQLFEAGNLKAEYIYNDASQRTRKTIYN